MFYYHFSQKSPKKLKKRRLHTPIMVLGWQRLYSITHAKLGQLGRQGGSKRGRKLFF